MVTRMHKFLRVKATEDYGDYAKYEAAINVNNVTYAYSVAATNSRPAHTIVYFDAENYIRVDMPFASFMNLLGWYQ